MNILFEKYSGCGNDFILIDNRLHVLPQPLSPDFVKHLCHRQKGIGADGVILLQDSPVADFRMRIFNSDGSEAEMCGNGIRCLSRYIEDHGIKRASFTIQTMHQLLPIQIVNSQIFVQMPMPDEIKLSIPLPLSGKTKTLTVHYADTGVPHAVLFVDDLNVDCLMEHAREIRFHDKFGQKGANVNYAKMVTSHLFHIRTYERGVEAETLACGTGAAAVALIARKMVHKDPASLERPINIIVKSQDQLSFSFDPTSHTMMMSGPAEKVFQGEVRVQLKV